MSTTVQFEGFPLTIHDWDDWVDPRHPVTGPKMTWGDNTTHALHYTAAVDLPDGDLSEFLYQIPPYLRAIQLDYLLHRPQPDGSTGYSIGYNHAVDWLGGIWELRGFDIKCAANKGWNDWTWATLCLVDGSDPLTDLALRSVRYLHKTGEEFADKVCVQRPHSQLHYDGTLLPWPGTETGCPGFGIRSQILNGETNWRYVQPLPPPEVIMASDYKALVKVSGDTKRTTALVLVSSGGTQMFGIPEADVTKVASRAEVSPTPDNITAQLYDDFQMRALRSAGFRPVTETSFTAANGKTWTGLPG